MTGDEFLKVAEQLFVKNQTTVSEALARTIIGRAYYGAYHLTVAYLVGLGFPETSDHKLPPNWLAASGEASARQAGRLLSELYSARRRADYKLAERRAVEESRSLTFVKSQIEIASDIRRLLVQCSQEPAKSQIQRGIEAFRQQTGPRVSSQRTDIA